MKEPILKLEHISKRLGGVPVLDGVSLQVEAGTFLGIVGTNGAGKTVLANILTGVLRADSGTLQIEGRDCSILSPAQARELGIYAVNQTTTLVDKLTVAENLCFDQKSKSPGGLVSWKRWNDSAKELLEELSIPLSPKILAGSLNLGQKRLLELAKLYAHHPRIAILDDCFGALSPQELEMAGRIVQQLHKDGITILYFSHRVEPMFRRCDAVVFIQDSRITGTIQKSEYSEEAAFDEILREQKTVVYPKLPGKRGREVLRVRNLSAEKAGLHDISFELKKGEILGVAGALDSGKHQLARALFGVEPYSKGEIIVNEEVLTATAPRAAILRHIGYLPEDTCVEGLIPSFSIEQNIGVARLMKRAFFYQRGRYSHKNIADDYVRRLHIDCASVRQKVKALSAGNQQKVNIAKWLQADCSILILEEPFKEIDSANRVDLYNYICQLVAAGTSILLFSSNYDELIGLSDRILVLKQGRIKAVFDSKQCNVKDLVEYTY